MQTTKTNYAEQAKQQRERLPSYHPFQKLSERDQIAELMRKENARVAADIEQMKNNKSHFYFQD